jgi:hypothetical protein
MREMHLHYDYDGNPIDLWEWVVLFEDTERRQVARTTIGRVTISTVWLGLNHCFLGEGPPLIYETMIFGGPHDEAQWRYASKEAALAGHDRAVALACDPRSVRS